MGGEYPAVGDPAGTIPRTMPARNGANGSESRKTTVCASGVSISRIVLYVDRCGDRFRGSSIHWNVSRTSAEESSLPSWNRTPLRNRNTISAGGRPPPPPAPRETRKGIPRRVHPEERGVRHLQDLGPVRVGRKPRVDGGR